MALTAQILHHVTSGYFLLKKKLSGTRFDTFQELQSTVQGYLQGLTKGASCMSWKSGPADWTSALQSRETMLKSNFYKHICIFKNYKIIDQVLFMLERPS